MINHRNICFIIFVFIVPVGMGGDSGGRGDASPLEFVWDRFFFEFAINPSLPLHFVPPPCHTLTLQEIAAHACRPTVK